MLTERVLAVVWRKCRLQSARVLMTIAGERSLTLGGAVHAPAGCWQAQIAWHNLHLSRALGIGAKGCSPFDDASESSRALNCSITAPSARSLYHSIACYTNQTNTSVMLLVATIALPTHYAYHSIACPLELMFSEYVRLQVNLIVTSCQHAQIHVHSPCLDDTRLQHQQIFG